LHLAAFVLWTHLGMSDDNDQRSSGVGADGETALRSKDAARTKR